MTLTCSSHLEQLMKVEDRDKVVKYLLSVLSPKVDEFDAITVSGYSMALIAPIVADRLNKNLVLVRKRNEDCHSCYNVEGIHNQRCVFIDDLIASGHTLEYVRDSIRCIECYLVGIVLYKDYCHSDGLYDIKCWGANYVS